MKEILISLARASIMSGLDKGVMQLDKVRDEYPFLQEQGACFVTLTLEDELRGCIGSTKAYRTLLEDLVHNAQAAAFRDPRFMPLTQEELQSVRIEVSLLSEPKALEYTDMFDIKNKVRIGIDGVILKLGNNQATFLPQVWEMLKSHELFFSHLCEKAGLGIECLSKHPQILVYQVEKIKEN